MSWKCKTGGCTFAIPKDTAISCVCSAMVLGKVTQPEIEKLEMIERLRVQREIERVKQSLPGLLEKLNWEAA